MLPNALRSCEEEHNLFVEKADKDITLNFLTRVRVLNFLFLNYIKNETETEM